jgi:hypothetical protein
MVEKLHDVIGQYYVRTVIAAAANWDICKAFLFMKRCIHAGKLCTEA